MERTSPTDFERAYYYDGLQRVLLARTSTYQYPKYTHPLQDHASYAMYPREKKVFTTIGDHPILSIWSDKLVASIQDALDGLEWHAFYPIRIGVRGSGYGLPYRELVLMVDITPATADWGFAISKALACRSLLRDAGIPDIEVEIREIRRGHHGASLRDFEKVIEPAYWNASDGPGTRSMHYSYHSELYNTLVDFLPCLGHTIATEATAGTMGLYLKLAGRPSEVYGLTCRHVVMDRRESREGMSGTWWLPDEEEYKADSDTKKHAVQRGTERQLNDLSCLVARYKWTDRMQDDLDRGRGIIKYLEKIPPFVDEDSEKYIDTRNTGHVAFMPPLEVSQRGFIRDWALIRLDLTKFPDPVVNVVPVRRSSHMRRISCENCEDTCFATIQGPESREFVPPRESIEVAKYGSATQLQFGMTNEIEAIFRLPMSGRPKMLAREWIVIHESEKNFSQKGDSGAAVFNMDRQVVGMLTGGAVNDEDSKAANRATTEDGPKGFPRYKDGVDLSFVTPIQYVLEDIELVTGCRPEVV
ncbi:hypothetical protein QBC46DRAFT_308371 [Diplogelasinospora grovesii]|uniref:Uncharacterized protein n=1 Tax=Diplogelasinospora grovesii TaxID=303347 RepID=A0AAN6NCC5_9PEZI|nr:hypothetical protein QBC46DRAFT_308371 [Diplogelasinospora grovesii]